MPGNILAEQAANKGSKMKKYFVFIFILLITTDYYSQSMGNLHILLLGSEGKKNVVFYDGSLPDFEDLSEQISNAFSFKRSENVNLLLNETDSLTLFQTIANSFRYANENDVYFIALFGPWLSEDSTQYKFLTDKNIYLTDSYFLNFIDYLPTKNVLLFIVEPGNNALKNKRLEKGRIDSANSGGFYAVEIKSDQHNNFEDICSLFVDMFDDVKDYLEDENVSKVYFSMWLNEVKKFWIKKNINVSLSRLTEQPDYMIKILGE